MRKKILVISHDKVGPSMAGPGIRYHQIATNLSKKHDVTLAVFNPSYIENIGKTSYKAIDIHVQKFQEEFAKYDAIIALWLSDEMIEFAKANNVVLIFDLYAPVPVEDLVQRVFGKRIGPESDYDYTQMLRNYQHFIRNGDYLLTSNEQQRDFWMGYAFSAGKTTPTQQSKRPIDSYLGICPMGIDLSQLDVPYKPLAEERIKGLKKDDYLILWTGGIWDWFDAVTPIKAINHVVKSGKKNVKLVFLGTKHPNDDVPAMEETEVARKLAKKLGLIDKHVFFLNGWLPYDDRIHYFERADAAIYAHKPSIESRFSHRTRVLDHILTGLPTIATKGDYFSDYIDAHELGISVEPFDDKAMGEAIGALMSSPKLQKKIEANVKKSQPEFTWDYTLKPLNAFIESNFFAPSPRETRVTTSSSEAVMSSKAVRSMKRLVPKKAKNIIKRIITK
ncbi:MAG TPA: glycosyltransferase family 4 protein [Candidatus Saccharimonadales bacterium]|nr:glycosyltransferase family 4 protein [Candidatus Saccharimonadales bacterium]